MIRFVFSLLLCAAAATPETLFDGTSLRNFRTPTRLTGPEVSWRITGGALESLPDAERQCDLWTNQAYENFDLEFDWLVQQRGNTGIKYLIQASNVDHLATPQGRKYLHETSLGYEFQLVAMDPATAVPSTHCSGALYNYLAPVAVNALAPGEWNTARLVVNRRNVEHWINGRRVLAYSLDSPELKAALRARNLSSSRMMDALQHRSTAIAFQHHNSAVAFRNIRIRVLPD